MQVSAADGSALRGDLVTRVVLRTDLTPVPSSVEITVVQTRETLAAIRSGAVVRVGASQAEYRLEKVQRLDGMVRRGEREFSAMRATGFLNSCAALARPLSRSIIREGSSFAEIYRSIGADAQIGADFTVPSFAALIGMSPTPAIARVLQEEGACVFYAGGKLQFRRLQELASAKAIISYEEDRTEAVDSDTLERHGVPFAFTTLADNTISATKRETGRGVVYRPRADARILNNMGVALVTRRKKREGLSPDFNAGTRVDIAGRAHIVVTAAHVRQIPDEGESGEEFTQLWLGEVLS